MASPSVLLLVPAYNEAGRIQPVLVRYATYFRENYGGPFRMVIVLNGCRDDTLGVVRQAAAQYPEIQWVVFEDAIGKGGALIEGLKLAGQAELIGFVDADGATPPESFHQLIRRCATTDCVIGSRRLPGSIIHQSQPTQRLLASRVFHGIVEVLFHMGIKDTQCGAKVMKRDAARRIQDSLHIADMAFDINLLYCLQREGFEVVEAPVEWTDHLGSTVRYFRTSLVMFLSVVRLRIIHSPFRRLLVWMRPLETLIYRALRNPPPRATSDGEVPTVHGVNRGTRATAP